MDTHCCTIQISPKSEMSARTDSTQQHHQQMQPSVRSTSVFQPDIFKGKVLFCTGATSQKGICYGQTLSMMRHGCDAAIFGRNRDVIEASAAQLSKDTGRRCIGLAGDVKEPSTLEEAVKRTVQEFGRIDFVIAGAAGNFLSSIERASPNAFKRVIEIDLLGTYNTMKATLPELKKTQGAIVAVSATLQKTGGCLRFYLTWVPALRHSSGLFITLIRFVASSHFASGARRISKSRCRRSHSHCVYRVWSIRNQGQHHRSSVSSPCLKPAIIASRKLAA